MTWLPNTPAEFALHVACERESVAEDFATYTAVLAAISAQGYWHVWWVSIGAAVAVYCLGLMPYRIHREAAERALRQEGMR
ncbi:MAG: hypothetical protein QM661_09615 [Solimonas sp.]